MIVVEEVHKRYGPVHALEGVSFRATRGGITAILGPNGAGKTTLVEILEGYRSPDSGRVEVLGYDPRQGGREYRERIGIMLQASGFYEELTVLETLRLFCGYYPRPRRPEELVEVVGLEARAAVQVGRLSGGERRRLDLALALAGNPEMLFLDEPTTGFDPEARRSTWGSLQEISAGGATVLLTTHYMEEAENLADRVLILVQGQVVADGSPYALAERLGAGSTIRFRLGNGALLAGLPDTLRDRAAVVGNSIVVTSSQPADDVAALHVWAAQVGERLDTLQVSRASLEDAYLDLVRGHSSGRNSA